MMVMSNSANVFMCSAYLTEILGMQCLYTSVVKLLLLKLV